MVGYLVLFIPKKNKKLRIYINYRQLNSIICYGPSVISIIVTKGGHPRGSELYGTSGTMGQGVAELRSYTRTKHTDVLTYLRTKRTDVPTYSTITIGRSYVFKYIVPTIR